jgi:hypothetical protein
MSEVNPRGSGEEVGQLKLDNSSIVQLRSERGTVRGARSGAIVTVFGKGDSICLRAR